jgi:hypothetical protein
MKNIFSQGAGLFFRAWLPSIAAVVFAGVSVAHAGLTFELDLMVQSQGQSYFFVTPLLTNATAPAAPLGTYIVSSPQWPTNGSSGQFQLTASGMSSGVYSEWGYGDLASVLTQITNGTWTILVTNATTTNLYTFKVNASNLSSNLFSTTIITFPADGAVILPSQTNFTWQGPTTWQARDPAQVYNNSYYRSTNVTAGQDSWNVDSSFPAGTNYTFSLFYQTNYASPLFVASTPLNTNNTQLPISGWASSTLLENSASVNFSVVTTYGSPEYGHTCLGYYTFEDNNLFVHDFSGNDNNMSYAWFGAPPTIVTNDAAAGTYAGGFGGSGWFTPPDSLRSLFAGSFSVSLWLKTTNVHGFNTDGQYSAAGIVSDLSGDQNNAAMPMGQTGSKLAFYTGGSSQNLLRSQANINAGQYVHVVTTRDQQTGEKRIYINGGLDSSVHAATDLLTGSVPGALTIGYNNGNVFAGKMDEIQFYSGVLSSNEVAFLHSHPGTNVADTLELSMPVARFDFEDTNSPGTDSSGHNNNANCGSGGTNYDTFSTNAAVGSYSRQFFGDTSICFAPGGTAFPNLSNALAGSFTVTAWVNTTNSAGSDYNNAYFGSPILFLYNSDTNSTIPLTITGSKAAFTIYDENGNAVTLHSKTTVNDGNYHFLAVTRIQTNGQMNLYVDGNLEASGTSSTHSLQIPWIHLAGGYFVPYTGLLDDVRIYAGALDTNDVALLAGTFYGRLGTALDSPALPWITSGNSSWFVETTNTYDGVSAAQSGFLSDNSKSSSLQTTVTGPGVLTFWWNAAYNDNFDLEFDIDGGYGIFTHNDDFTGNDWTQDTFTIPAGVHTLTWFAYNADSTNDTGWVDQVVFTPASAVNVLNPQSAGANFQFSFLSQNGFTHDIQYSTNLVTGNWQTYSSIGGDGTLKTISLPFAVFSPSPQGFIRVQTQ